MITKRNSTEELNFFLQNYTVYRSGLIYGFKKKKFLKPNKIKGGYMQVTLCCNNARKSFLVHRVVAHIYLPSPKPGEQVNHKNLIKEDNSFGNLEWVSPSENMYHMYENIGYKIQRPRHKK
jgi:hypothetical protein